MARQGPQFREKPCLAFLIFIHPPIKTMTHSDLQAGTVYCLKFNGVKIAKGKSIDDRFIVEKGARIRIELLSSASDGIKSLRKSMIRNDVLINKGSHYELKESYEFDSPSKAASLILGRQSSSKEWEEEVSWFLIIIGLGFIAVIVYLGVKIFFFGKWVFSFF